MPKKSGAVLKELMHKKGVTHMETAERLQMGPASFSRKLNGMVPFYPHECVLICRLFGRSISDLLPERTEAAGGLEAEAQAEAKGPRNQKGRRRMVAGRTKLGRSLPLKEEDHAHKAPGN